MMVAPDVLQRYVPSPTDISRGVRSGWMTTCHHGTRATSIQRSNTTRTRAASLSCKFVLAQKPLSAAWRHRPHMLSANCECKQRAKRRELAGRCAKPAADHDAPTPLGGIYWLGRHAGHSFEVHLLIGIYRSGSGIQRHTIDLLYPLADTLIVYNRPVGD